MLPILCSNFKSTMQGLLLYHVHISEVLSILGRKDNISWRTQTLMTYLSHIFTRLCVTTFIL